MNRKIFTFTECSQGIRFQACLGSKEQPLNLHEVVDLWCDRDNDGRGAEIVYGHGRVVETPIKNRTDSYTIQVLHENFNG